MTRDSPLPGFVDPRVLLSKHALAPKRRYSQNFLVARPTVEAIAAAATFDKPSALVELGPGLGTLTLELMRRCDHVLAVESDPDMRRVLTEELVPYGLQLQAGDATELDYSSLCSLLDVDKLHVAGNLPYAVTGGILRGLVEQREVIASAVVMLQREVRDRLLAAPATREYGALTVFCQAAFEIDSVLQVPATAFVPRPKVASAVIRLRARQAPLAQETEAFRAVVRAAFQKRRKTLRNALAALADSQRAAAVLQSADIDPMRRGETLSIAEFALLAETWQRDLGPPGQ